MPSRPSLQACRNTVSPSSSMCSLNRMPGPALARDHLKRSGSRPPKGRLWRGSPARRKARRKVQQLSTINSCHNDRGKPCFSTAHRRRGTPGCDTERLLCSRHGSAATDFLSSERLKKPSELSAKARRHNGGVKGKPRHGLEHAAGLRPRCHPSGEKIWARWSNARSPCRG